MAIAHYGAIKCRYQIYFFFFLLFFMFTLPQLQYDMDGLTGFVTTETMEFHYGKHHAAYVKNLNNLVQDTPYADMTLEQIIASSKSEGNIGVFNNAAQHWNHDFFWKCLSPNGGSTPTGEIATRIARDFGSFEAFRDQFTTTAAKHFGSGWAWLIEGADGTLSIEGMKDADTPVMNKENAILTLDVWEHAYYIDYRNKRPDYIKEFWNVINWDFANQNLSK